MGETNRGFALLLDGKVYPVNMNLFFILNFLYLLLISKKVCFSLDK